MRAVAILALAPALALLAPGPAPQEAAPREPETTSPVRRDFRDTIETNGRFVPAEFEEISFWPRAYGGELLFLEVVPHGTFVNAGDVIARFDTRAIDEQIADAERDLNSAELQHESAVVRADLDEQAAQVQLEDAVLSLERAQKALEGWEKYELPFHHRANEMSKQRMQYGIDDQVDELAQLEAMYRDDELVEAVEEIVLNRSRRSLASARAGQALSLDRMAFDDEYRIAETGRSKLRSVETQEGALDRLVRSQELDRKFRQEGIAKSEVQLAKKRERLEGLRADRERLTVRAPRPGVVLHGGAMSYLPRQQPPEHRRGSRGSFRTALFCVANPDRLDVALRVSESQLRRVREGMGAEVRPLVTENAKALGVLHVDRYPIASSAPSAEGSFAARIVLEGARPGIVVGMRAEVALVCETLEDVLMLPTAAVFTSGESAWCWAASAPGREFVKVPLSLGPAEGDLTVVYGDLDEHALVLREEPEE